MVSQGLSRNFQVEIEYHELKLVVSQFFRSFGGWWMVQIRHTIPKASHQRVAGLQQTEKF